MKCSIMLHFILVFTVCKGTRLGVPKGKGLNKESGSDGSNQSALIQISKLLMLNFLKKEIAFFRDKQWRYAVQPNKDAVFYIQ